MSRPGKVLVTGAPGILGSQFVPRLLSDGYDVTCVSLEAWEDAPCPHYVCDLESFGQTLEAVGGFDAVLHLAAVHAEGVRTPARTFGVNTVSTFNVLHAAAVAGVPRVVWASSTHAAGGRWGRDHGPVAVPVTEEDANQTGDSYGLSKLAAETLTRHARAFPSVSICGLRYGYVYAPDQYDQVRARWDDPEYWAHSLWNYVDVRDAYEVTRLALSAQYTGGHVLNVTALDQSMNTPTRELVATYLPQTRIDPGLPEYGTLLSVEAGRRLLGHVPQHSWRDHIEVG